jgi:hypothetical protein
VRYHTRGIIFRKRLGSAELFGRVGREGSPWLDAAEEEEEEEKEVLLE